MLEEPVVLVMSRKQRRIAERELCDSGLPRVVLTLPFGQTPTKLPWEHKKWRNLSKELLNRFQSADFEWFPVQRKDFEQKITWMYVPKCSKALASLSSPQSS